MVVCSEFVPVDMLLGKRGRERQHVTWLGSTAEATREWPDH